MNKKEIFGYIDGIRRDIGALHTKIVELDIRITDKLAEIEKQINITTKKDKVVNTEWQPKIGKRYVFWDDGEYYRPRIGKLTDIDTRKLPYIMENIAPYDHIAEIDTIEVTDTIDDIKRKAKHWR